MSRESRGVSQQDAVKKSGHVWDECFRLMCSFFHGMIVSCPPFGSTGHSGRSVVKGLHELPQWLAFGIGGFDADGLVAYGMLEGYAAGVQRDATVGV